MAPGAAGTDWEAVWRGDTSSVRPYASPALEVLTYEGAGRGVRARDAVPVGAVLLAEQAVAVAPEHDLAGRLCALQGDLDDTTRRRLALMCDGSDLAPVEQPIALPSWPGALGCGSTSGEEITVARMRRIVDLNAYRLCSDVGEYAFRREEDLVQSDSERHSAYGVFPLGSLVNHSCAVNVSKVLLNDWVFLRAARDIAPGEELLQHYCDIRAPLGARQKELQDLFGFACACPRCHFERALGRAGGEGLAAYQDLYACMLPGLNALHGPIQVSHLEGAVAGAERAAAKSLRQVDRGALPVASDEELTGWLAWPLVPALSQLAERLGLDGRFAESRTLWRKAEAAVRAVDACSNVHVVVLARWLLAEAQGGDEAHVAAALAESRRVTRLAYGGGDEVWQRLVGFRLPSALHALPEQSQELTFEWLPAGDAPGDALGGGEPGDALGRPRLRAGVVKVSLPPAVDPEGVSLDASETRLVVRCPGAGALEVPCPFAADLDALRTRLSKRTRSLSVFLTEKRAA